MDARASEEAVDRTFDAYDLDRCPCCYGLKRRLTEHAREQDETLQRLIRNIRGWQRIRAAFPAHGAADGGGEKQS
jgi:hypothetical protein